MADQAKTASEKPLPPVKTKVVRSQKILDVQSPTERAPPPRTYLDTQSDPDDDNVAKQAPPLPRSHTPGHLATKSQDRSRKPPAELSARQRSQSSAVGAAKAAASSAPQTASYSATLPLPSRTPGPGSTSASRHAVGNGEKGEGSLPRERQDSPINNNNNNNNNNSNNGSGRRGGALRSTSAIASKPSAAPANSGAEGPGAGSTSARHASGATTTRGGSTAGATARAGRGRHVSSPPVPNSRTAPDVPVAPASGMYWSRAPVSGWVPTAFRAHTTTLVGSNVFVFGGCDARTCFNDLYVLDADAFHWSAPPVGGDVPVPLRAMTCTAVGKKLVVFGGGDGPAYCNDIYVLDTVNFRWSRPRIAGDRVPSKRRAHTACLYKGGIYVFGGGDGVRALNDIWRLDVTDFSKLAWKLVSGPSGSERSQGSKDERPKARGYHTANMVGSKLIIFGGSDGGECFNDVWIYDVDTRVWKMVNIAVTFRRLSHTATIVGSYLFVIGGHDGNEYSNDVLLLNLVTMAWDKRKVYGMPPSGRGYHGTVLYDSRLLMIGGFDGNEVFGDVWILELAVHAYYSQISHFAIEV